jgi:anaerobic selenocysteine-containing dehydrogenase
MASAEIESRQGRAWSTLRVEDAVPIGTVFMPMHWGDAWSSFASPNEATADACDPISKEPAVKFCAVNVRQYRHEEVPDDPLEMSKHLVDA